MRAEILDIGFDPLEPGTALEKVLALADTGRCAYVVTPNPEIVYLSRKDPALRRALNGADLVLADGIGVLYAAKILGAPLRCRVTGVGMASALLPHLAREGKRLFLLGAAPGVAEEAAEKLKNQYPGLDVCGVMDGYYKDDADAVGAINEAEPDAVFVCLGSPKQELFMAEYAGQIKAGLMIGLGGGAGCFFRPGAPRAPR